MASALLSASFGSGTSETAAAGGTVIDPLVVETAMTEALALDEHPDDHRRVLAVLRYLTG